MSEKLKPCPFCGSGDVVLRPFWNGTYQVGCTQEQCRGHVMSGPQYESRKAAIAAWNRRAGDE